MQSYQGPQGLPIISCCSWTAETMIRLCFGDTAWLSGALKLSIYADYIAWKLLYKTHQRSSENFKLPNQFQSQLTYIHTKDVASVLSWATLSIEIKKYFKYKNQTVNTGFVDEAYLMMILG